MTIAEDAMDVRTASWRQRDGWCGELPAWDGPSTLVMAYGAADLLSHPAPLRELVDTYPTSCVLGCSTAGGDATDTGLQVAVTRFAGTRLSSACLPLAGSSSYDTGRRLARQLRGGDPDVQAVVVLADGKGVDGGALVAGLRRATDRPLALSGGLAGGDDAPPWVLADDGPRGGKVAAVGFSGPGLTVRQGSRGCWDSFGPERRVTRSRGAVLFELDGEPALRLYRRQLGHRIAGAAVGRHPLSVRPPGAAQPSTLRTVVSVDELTQSLTLAGDVPQGATAQLLRVGDGRVLGAAQHAAADADGLPAPQLAMAISCAGGLLSGRYGGGELQAVAAGLPPATAVVGSSCVAILPTGQHDLTDRTICVTTFAERL